MSERPDNKHYQAIHEDCGGQVGFFHSCRKCGQKDCRNETTVLPATTVTFDEYQRLAGRTAAYPGRSAERPTVWPEDPPLYPFLGLPGEAGEVCEQAKKALRDDDGRFTEERRSKLRKELGDVLWYVAAICDESGLEMAEVAQANIGKLKDRQRRGVIRGEGDDR